MVDNEKAPEVRQIDSAEAIHAAIADKVRGDSHAATLTHIETLGALFPGLTPERIIEHLTALVKTEPYRDIKVMTSASGATFLYSDTIITAADASAEILAEQVQAKIADRVRADSKERVQLTLVKSFAELAPEVEPNLVEGYIAAMAGDERYQDIKQLTGPTGLAYLHSDTTMTHNYANLLARIETNDTCALIAETVREESQIYPRPTKVELFYAPIFKIDPDQMEMVVEQTLKRPEYQDIKKVVASTQAVYLYSAKYMVAPQVERWVQYQEVERFQYQ